MREPEQRLGSPYGSDADASDLLCGPGEILHRAQLASGHGKNVDGPEQRGRQRAMRRAEALGGSAEVPYRGSGQDFVGRELSLGGLDLGLTLVDVVVSQHDLDDDRDSPDHHDGSECGHDLPPSAARATRRDGILVAAGLAAVGARLPSQAGAHPRGAYCWVIAPRRHPAVPSKLLTFAARAADGAKG